jgi:hypothetical protein
VGTTGMVKKVTKEDILRDWPAGEYLYKSPDHVPGTHPAETGDVTWHTGIQLSKAQPNVARQDQALRKEGAE